MNPTDSLHDTTFRSIMITDQPVLSLTITLWDVLARITNSHSPI